MDSLETLKSSHPQIGEVRGKGLMIGVELVKAGTKEPDAQLAEHVRAACLEKQVLVGVGGIHGNVVRIQPPLVIQKEQLENAILVIGEAISGS